MLRKWLIFSNPLSFGDDLSVSASFVEMCDDRLADVGSRIRNLVIAASIVLTSL